MSLTPVSFSRYTTNMLYLYSNDPEPLQCSDLSKCSNYYDRNYTIKATIPQGTYCNIFMYHHNYGKDSMMLFVVAKCHNTNETASVFVTKVDNMSSPNPTDTKSVLLNFLNKNTTSNNAIIPNPCIGNESSLYTSLGFGDKVNDGGINTGGPGHAIIQICPTGADIDIVVGFCRWDYFSNISRFNESEFPMAYKGENSTFDIINGVRSYNDHGRASGIYDYIDLKCDQTLTHGMSVNFAGAYDKFNNTKQTQLNGLSGNYNDSSSEFRIPISTYSTSYIQDTDDPYHENRLVYSIGGYENSLGPQARIDANYGIAYYFQFDKSVTSITLNCQQNYNPFGVCYRRYGEMFQYDNIYSSVGLTIQILPNPNQNVNGVEILVPGGYCGYISLTCN